MFCSKCGKEIPANANVCPNCGQPLNTGQRMESAADQFARNANASLNRAEQQMGEAFNDVRNQFNGQGNGGNNNYMGREPLKTDRSLGIYILLTIVTCGIYSYYFIYQIAHDINIACDGDGDETGGLVKYLVLSFITCGIYSWYWEYKLGNRLAQNAPRYGLQFQENGTTVLMWLIFGSFICGIGQFIAMHILIKNSNSICMAYNQRNGFYN
jgi:hypothetical protein